jgi:predicted alpha-1,2-mannosidase
MMKTSITALGGLATMLLLGPFAGAQSLFLDFNTPGQYTGNFNPWNDNGAGSNGGNYSFVESSNSGADTGGGVNVPQSNDTTATYGNGSWNFSTNGATIFVSVLLKANSQTSGNKIQLGIQNNNTNGFNSNTGVAFETFRFVPSSAAVWSLREQFRSNNTNSETTLGTVNVIPGRWYKFAIALTNTSGASGNYNGSCSFFDYGTDGLTPGTNLATFSTVRTHSTGQDIAKLSAVWPGLRAFQNAGLDAWDNFLVYTTNSQPLITLPLTNMTVAIGAPATFKALADGPGVIGFSWFTNGSQVLGANDITCTVSNIDSSYTNLAVVVSNGNGSVTNSVVLTPIVPTVAALTNLPATGIEPFAATVNGQVLSSGGQTPNITVYYGTTDGGTNAGAWAHSIFLGPQNGSFAYTISGLATNTTVYFSASASNVSGLSWAVPSGSFTTLPVAPPTDVYVNPFLGTAPGGSGFGFGGDSGDTFPGAAYPRGMVQWSPDTPSNLPGGYYYLDGTIKGFSVRHFSGRGCNVYQDFAFMPCLGPVSSSPGTNFGAYSSGFSHTNESASPGYYRVLLNNGVQTELTVTKRTGLGLFTFPNTNAATLLINAGSSINGTTPNTSINIISNNQVQGFATAPIGCGSQLYTIYFVALFDHPFASFGTWNSNLVAASSITASGPQIGAYLTFDATTNPLVLAKIGISFVSISNALANLDAENTTWNFGALKSAADSAWNGVLNKVTVTGETSANLQTFYTALYHCFFHPNVFSDANGQYLGMDGIVHTVSMGHAQYENIPGWDIYRSGAWLMALLSPSDAGDVAQSLVNYAQQGGGGLPRWEQANRNSGGMVGDGPLPIIAAAYALGATNFDTASALTAMFRNAGTNGTTSDGNTVRDGLNDYINLGYVSGSASVTLEYCSADFALSQFAAALGDTTDVSYLIRSGNWRNLFNTNTGYLQPRNSDGTWVASVTPSSQTGFTEGSTAQYLWMVPFNVRGLFDTLGGNSNAIARLDNFFTRLNDGPGTIYAFMGNEPNECVPWEYDYAGAPYKTQAIVRRIQSQLFTNTPAGMPGNDDAGALSSWYVFSALGFYPLVPGTPGFVLGSPRFPSATIHLENGNDIQIRGNNASSDNCYVQSFSLNGTPTSSLWLPFDAIRNGGSLTFNLGNAPSNWGTSPAAAPPSFNNQPPVRLAVNVLPGPANISLSWPAWAANYSLYSTTNLVAPIQWLPVTNAPQTNNGAVVLNFSASNYVQQFFRLQSP